MKTVDSVPITGWEGFYSIGRNGDVISHGRTFMRSHGEGYTKRTIVLKPGKIKNGYMMVSLIHREHKRKYVYVHRLMASAFIPNPRGLNEVNHINGRRDDNRLENLEWVTRSENIRHAINVTKTWDHQSHCKLTPSKVRRIRTMRDKGLTFQSIADEYGISEATARDAYHRRCWGNVA